MDKQLQKQLASVDVNKITVYATKQGRQWAGNIHIPLDGNRSYEDETEFRFSDKYEAEDWMYDWFRSLN